MRRQEPTSGTACAAASAITHRCAGPAQVPASPSSPAGARGEGGRRGVSPEAKCDGYAAGAIARCVGVRACLSRVVRSVKAAGVRLSRVRPLRDRRGSLTPRGPAPSVRWGPSPAGRICSWRSARAPRLRYSCRFRREARSAGRVRACGDPIPLHTVAPQPKTQAAAGAPNQRTCSAVATFGACRRATLRMTTAELVATTAARAMVASPTG